MNKPFEDKQTRLPMHPGFAKEALRCAKNLLSGLVVHTFLGNFFHPSRESMRDWYRNAYDEANHCDRSIGKFAVIGQNTFLGIIDWKTSRWVAFPLKLFMGLLILPFATLKTAIKLILLVPRLCILRAEDYLRGQASTDKMLESLSNTILYRYTRYFVEQYTRPETHIGVIRCDFQEFINSNNLAKLPFGPGHFIYMALYHLTFTAALASMPLLLYKFDKLPNVPVLCSSLGLIALLSISFIALNLRQCLKINRDVDFHASIKTYNHCTTFDKEKGYGFFAEAIDFLINDVGIKSTFDTNIGNLKKATDNNARKQLIESTTMLLYEKTKSKICKKKALDPIFAADVGCALATYITRDSLRCGNGFRSKNTQSLLILDEYDATTDIGTILTAPIARLLDTIRVDNPSVAARKGMSLT